VIKNYEEYKQYGSRLLTRGISTEESVEIKKEMGEFSKANPNIFEKMQRKKMAPSLSDLVVTY